MKQIIRVQNISKHYELGSASNGTLREMLSSFSPSKKEVFKALDDVSFEVNKGESLAIIGHNGAGKSTLLKVLSKITKPTSGRIEMDGRVTSLLEVGTGFHPELTGRENIYLNGSILGMNKAEITRKFGEIVAFSGVEKFLDTPVKHYSSGMYVRLAFSVAAHLESEILIIDEVLAVGDIEFQDKCLGKMSDITQEGKTILFVSHNLQAVAKLCNRGIVLNHGKTQYSGDINSAIHFYQNNLASGPKTENSFDQEDRQGNGKFRFIGITVKNITKASSTIYSGDDIQINASIQCNKPVKANVVCRIYDSFNTRITSLTSSYFKLKLDLTDESQISWRLPKLALTGGVYRLELAAYEDFSGLILIDEVENALNLVVEDQDFYGFGVPQSKGRNKIYLDFSVNAS